MSSDQSRLLLQKQLNDLTKNPVDGFSAGLVDESNIYKWQVFIMGPPSSPYEGGNFRAELIFPKDYPLCPPTMRFISRILHPNNREGNVCISILHEPGDDRFGYEKASERWLPVHTVETILISGNKLYRENPAEYKRQVARCVRETEEL
uniref:UBC core domain-containing protein n=1 Tax=Meloidogyne javanica TaxID=6303 RepID=A0A915M4Y5_MELJA